MALSTSVDTTTVDRDERRRQARRARYDAQRVLWTETRKERLAYCGRVVTDATKGVTLRCTHTGAGRRAGFSGLQTCGSVWSCPVCAEKINAKRQSELEAAITVWQQLGGAVVFGTVTMAHTADDRLEDLWDAISPAFNRMTSGAGRAWNGSKGSPLTKTGKPRKGWTLGDKAEFGIEHYVRLVEVKHGDENGWHPHIHFLLFLRAELDDRDMFELRSRLFDRWLGALAKKGYHASQQRGIDLRRVADGEAIADYFAKNGYEPKRLESTPGAAAYEVTGSQSKQQGKGGRTPFQILAELVHDQARLFRDPETKLLVDLGTGEVSKDLMLWLEWEKVSAGRRQITWSHGFRKLIAELSPDVEEVELTDEEIAEDDQLDGDEVLVIDTEEWNAGKWALRRATLLEAAERSDRAARLLVGRSWHRNALQRMQLAGANRSPG